MQILLHTGVSIVESQERNSEIQEDHLQTDLMAEQLSTTCKRRLECKENVSRESTKHVKED